MPDERDRAAGQKAAEAGIERFRAELGPFVVAAEKTRMAMVFTDAKLPGNPIVFANDSFLSLTGQDRDEVLGRGLPDLMAQGAAPGTRAAIEAAFAAAGAGEQEIEQEIQYRRKDGTPFWATLFVSPVRDEGDTVVQHFASFQDATRHVQDKQRLRFLLDELNHRTQNTLATVQAIAVQTLHGAADKAAVAAFEGRILALSRAHILLGRENWEGVSLRDVAEQILQPFGLRDRRTARFTVAGDAVRLPPKAALTLAMVFNELATNAAKYGALSHEAEGRITLEWRVEPGAPMDRLRLRWQESGGPPVARSGHRGWGSRLIERGLPQELGGEARLDFAPAGVACEIVMPLPGARR